MKALLKLALALSLLGLSACSQQNPNCTDLPAGGRYCLQDTQLGPKLELQQEVQIEFKDKRETMIAMVENSSERLDFVGLTPFGQKMLHVRYDNQVASALLNPDKRLPPALMLSLLQLALWPAASVQAGLDAESKLQQQDNSRIISRHGQLLMQIDYADIALPYAQMKIDLPSVKLKLEIRNLADISAEPAPAAGYDQAP